MKNIKTAKKSMFITTLLIVVLLIAAVATATFAWFTQQDTVTAGGSRIIAAQATGASLGIGWTAGAAISAEGGNFSIELADMAPLVGAVGGLLPMAPRVLPIAGTTTLAAFSTMVSPNVTGFNEAFIDMDGDFLTPGRNVAPHRLSQYEGTGTEFFVGNTAATGGTVIDGVQLSFDDISGPLAAALRVAVFVNDTYVGTIATTATSTITYGAITAGATYGPDDDEDQNQSHLGTSDVGVFGLAGVALVGGTAGTPVATLAPQGNLRVSMFAWFDGGLLNNDNAVDGYATIVGITIRTTSTVTTP